MAHLKRKGKSNTRKARRESSHRLSETLERLGVRLSSTLFATLLSIGLGIGVLAMACTSHTTAPSQKPAPKDISNSRANFKPSNLRSSFLEPETKDLDAKSAVAKLNLEGKSGEQICKDRHSLESGSIPDYAERDFNQRVPMVNDSLADIYAIAATAVVYKSYETFFEALQNPTPEKLLCISRLISQPRLEIDWTNLSYLLHHSRSITGGKSPFRVTTVGVRSGEALVVGCLFGDAYGNSPNKIKEVDSFLFESVLAWIGGRWRVQSVTDHIEMGCDELPQLISAQNKRLTAEAEEFGWILPAPNKQDEWIWNKKEIIQWLHS